MMKISTAAENTPGSDIGSQTRTNTCTGRAPSTSAARSGSVGSRTIAEYMVKIAIGSRTWTIPITTASEVLRISAGRSITPSPISTVFTIPLRPRMIIQA